MHFRLECSLEAILSRALQNNPVLIVEIDKLKVEEATLDQTLSPFMPTIRAQLESNTPILNQIGVKGKQSIYTAQLVLDYNLFSGGRDLSKLKAQRERMVGAKKRVDAARRNAEKVCRNAWATYTSDIEQIIKAKQAVDVNIKLQRAYELQFELVARPLIDLLDAYVSYYRSKSELINAEADEGINHALLLASMGDLVSSVQPECAENL